MIRFRPKIMLKVNDILQVQLIRVLGVYKNPQHVAYN